MKKMPKRVTERGLFWTGVWCVLGAALVIVAGPPSCRIRRVSLAAGWDYRSGPSSSSPTSACGPRLRDNCDRGGTWHCVGPDGRPTDGAVTTIESLPTAPEDRWRPWSRTASGAQGPTDRHGTVARSASRACGVCCRSIGEDLVQRPSSGRVVLGCTPTPHRRLYPAAATDAQQTDVGMGDWGLGVKNRPVCGIGSAPTRARRWVV